MCYLYAQIVSKKIFPLGLVKQVNIICVNCDSKIRLLESNMVLIAISIDSDMMKGEKKSPPSNKNIKKDLAAEQRSL